MKIIRNLEAAQIIHLFNSSFLASKSIISSFSFRLVSFASFIFKQCKCERPGTGCLPLADSCHTFVKFRSFSFLSVISTVASHYHSSPTFNINRLIGPLGLTLKSLASLILSSGVQPILFAMTGIPI